MTKTGKGRKRRDSLCIPTAEHTRKLCVRKAPDLRMRDVMKGLQASESCPSKTAAGLTTVLLTGPICAGAVPSLSRAATMAATPPACQMQKLSDSNDDHNTIGFMAKARPPCPITYHLPAEVILTGTVLDFNILT